MVERCGDRQRKFDGLEKWPFRLFIESLPVILQIALLLLACGLSRRMWSVNISVARVVISFTVLGFLFYTIIVLAGTSSYGCPFQTPVSMVLRYIWHSAATQKLLTAIFPPKIRTWMSYVRSGIHGTATTIGHQTIFLLLHIDQAFGNAKERLAQGIKKFKCGGLLPTTTNGVPHQAQVPQNSPALRVPVWDLEILRRRNADNARCICWVLRNITDPEAIDSAIRLAGTIRWFDGDSDHNLPFDVIISTFEACFSPTKRLYPGMRDRAYFSAQAILQINMGARARSHAYTSKYPIPEISSSAFQHIDHDLHHTICMLECNSGHGRPIFNFPRGGTNTPTHLLWMSKLLVDVTHTGPNPTLKSYKSYLSVAFTDHQAMIADTLLMWYMLLGGCVEEETLWAVDRSYVVSLSLLSVLSMVCIQVTHWNQSSLTCLIRE